MKIGDPVNVRGHRCKIIEIDLDDNTAFVQTLDEGPEKNTMFWVKMENCEEVGGE